MTALLTCLGLTACPAASPPPQGMPPWQLGLLDAADVEVQWGYSRQGFQPLGPAKPLAGEARDRLRRLLAKPLPAGPFKCLVHVDGRLTSPGGDAWVCNGCGILIGGGVEHAVRERETLEALFTETLGPRPAEPADPSLEGY